MAEVWPADSPLTRQCNPPREPEEPSQTSRSAVGNQLCIMQGSVIVDSASPRDIGKLRTGEPSQVEGKISQKSLSRPFGPNSGPIAFRRGAYDLPATQIDRKLCSCCF